MNRSTVQNRLDTSEENSAASLYLDLMKKCLTRLIFPEKYSPISPPDKSPLGLVVRACKTLLAPLKLDLVRRRPADGVEREEGLDWPSEAETMIGLKRLNNLESCALDVIRRGVPGDFIETGVWRGGAAIFMRAVLKAYGDTERIVWVADSFEGLPKADTQRYPKDAAARSWPNTYLAVPLEEVQANFKRYGLLDEQVRFLAGWFRDTLPTAPIGRLAILRLDGDLYESTIDALTHLYPKLSLGGYAIIDDYALPPCRAAVDDYRAQQKITEEPIQIDRFACYWKRLS
jgi:O-methyltransferase